MKSGGKSALLDCWPICYRNCFQIFSKENQRLNIRWLLLHDVKPMQDVLGKALHTLFERYYAYLESFGPEESHLSRKVEIELGAKMIHLKMRCGGLGPEWGNVMELIP